MAIHRKKTHRIHQQTAAQILSTNQQSAVQGLMKRSLVPEKPTGETNCSQDCSILNLANIHLSLAVQMKVCAMKVGKF